MTTVAGPAAGSAAAVAHPPPRRRGRPRKHPVPAEPAEVNEVNDVPDAKRQRLAQQLQLCLGRPPKAATALAAGAVAQGHLHSRLGSYGSTEANGTSLMPAFVTINASLPRRRGRPPKLRTEINIAAAAAAAADSSHVTTAVGDALTFARIKRPRGRPRKYPLAQDVAIDAAATAIRAVAPSQVVVIAIGGAAAQRGGLCCTAASCDGGGSKDAVGALGGATAVAVAAVVPPGVVAAPPMKRPRGRPRKVPLPEPVRTVPPLDGEAPAAAAAAATLQPKYCTNKGSAIASVAAAVLPVKRPRGRPRKVPNLEQQLLLCADGGVGSSTFMCDAALAAVLDDVSPHEDAVNASLPTSSETCGSCCTSCCTDAGPDATSQPPPEAYSGVAASVTFSFFPVPKWFLSTKQ